MEAILLWLLVGVLHAGLRFALEWKTMAENRERAASSWYVGFGTRLSPEASLGIQIAASVLLWPVPAIKAVLKLFGR